MTNRPPSAANGSTLHNSQFPSSIAADNYRRAESEGERREKSVGSRGVN